MTKKNKTKTNSAKKVDALMKDVNKALKPAVVPTNDPSGKSDSPTTDAVPKLSKRDRELLWKCTEKDCPECGVYLDNNLSSFDEVLKAMNGDMDKALKAQRNEFECLECGHGWGPVMGEKAEDKKSEHKSPLQKLAEDKKELAPTKLISKKTGEPVKQYTNPSTVDKPVGRVHAIAEAMLEKDPAARRKDIVAACVEIGINIHTAKTQVQVYLKGLKDDAAARLAEAVTTKEVAVA